MWDLRDSKFQGYIDSEEVLKHVTPLDIFQFYVPGWSPQVNIMSSPMRNDTFPSFSIFYSDRYDTYLYKDYATGEVGNAIMLVSSMYNINKGEAAIKICYDMNLPLVEAHGQYNEAKLAEMKLRKTKFSSMQVKRKVADINLKSRDFNSNDLMFWNQFGITKNILRMYNVIPLSLLFINSHIFQVENYGYAYLENKDNFISTKIYQPYSSKHKFMNNNNESVLEGWSQLPSTGKKVIITSSRKDLMSIASINRIPSIAPQSESVMIKESVMEELKSRFDEVIVFYDNDFTNIKNPGRTLGKKLAQRYDIRQIEIPDYYGSKDYSDLVKNTNPTFAGNVLNKLING